MKLCDLRFVTRLVPCAGQEVAVYPICEEKKFLQVRHRLVFAHSITNELQARNCHLQEDAQWSDWEDVPLGVEE